MKKVLLATTALVLSAGVASAEVSVSGNARIGLTYNEADAQSTLMNSRVRIAFSASGETDSCLSYSASARIRTGNEGGASVNAFNELGVTISGAFGSLTVGSESSAAEYAVGDLAGVGYAGAGDGNETAFLNGAQALYSITAGGVTGYLSSGQLGGDALSAGASYTAGSLTVGAGYEDNGTATQTAASVAYTTGGTTIKAIYSKADIADIGAVTPANGMCQTSSTTAGVATLTNATYTAAAGCAGTIITPAVAAAAAVSGRDTQMGVSVAHTMGAVSLSAYYQTTENNAGASTNNYGMGVAYDLGGGAKLAAGVADINGNNRADLGINLSF
jgi:outer membrane protein OmpU